MSVWPMVLIVLAIAMLVGPIMLLQPSQRDRQLARLRQHAAAKGLVVRLDSYCGSVNDQQANKKQTVAVYSLPLSRPDDAISWRLFRESYAHDLHFHQQWQWAGKSPELSTASTTAFKQHLDTLPADILGIELTQTSIGLWWWERGESSVDDVYESLKTIYTMVKDQ